jgi:hypothetical protein
MASEFVRLNLGSVLIERSTWEIFKKHGFDREAVKSMIIGNGTESMSDQAYELLTQEEQAEHEKGKHK